MISYYVKQSSSEPVREYSSPPSGVSWAVASQVTPAEIDKLADRHGLDGAVFSDVLDRHELPRMEHAGEAMYVFFRAPHNVKRGEVLSAPLVAVMNGDVFITATVGSFSPPLEALEGQTISSQTFGTLLLATLASTVGEYENLIKKTARFIRETGHRLRVHEATNKDFIHFVTVEDNLNLFQRDLSGMLAVTSRLKDDLRYRLTDADRDALDDISLHIQQLLVSISSYTQSINSIRNAYSTVANNVLNQRMKILTTLTLLVALPNVFYGMYGMNVRLPFAEQPWAFLGIVLFTVSLIFMVLLIVKRSRIL